MIISVQINNQIYKINCGQPLHISIPLNFNGVQPNAYGVEKARAKPCVAGEIVGDTRRGGSVNFEQVKFIPHCNGTHTECVGHLTHERISVNDCLKDAFTLANLVSVVPVNAEETSESYAFELNDGDKLITRKSLENALNSSDFSSLESLIIRTLPNYEDKLSKTYLDKIPPFFSTDAIKFIAEIGIKHLLVDLPSIDRIFDDGKLSNHRIFWNIEQGSFETSAQSLINNTITELIYVPKNIADGEYLLNLQIAPFSSDASPSRPLLFELMK